jgi:hypothetical protein
VEGEIMVKGQRDQAKERYWRGHVTGWRRSGLGVRAYCAAEELSEPSFYAWRRVLSERKRCRSTASAGTARAPVSPFVPVRLVEEATASAPLEVVLRGGRVLRVAAGFAAQTLRDVVAALEELPC